MSVSSNIVSNTKKGIMMLNKLKESSENYVPKEEKNKKELSFENNDAIYLKIKYFPKKN